MYDSGNLKYEQFIDLKQLKFKELQESSQIKLVKAERKDQPNIIEKRNETKEEKQISNISSQAVLQ